MSHGGLLWGIRLGTTDPRMRWKGGGVSGGGRQDCGNFNFAGQLDKEAVCRMGLRERNIGRFKI